MRKRHSRDSRAPGNNEMHGVTPVLPNGAMGQRTAARRSLCIDSFPAAGGPSDDGYNCCCARTKELGVAARRSWIRLVLPATTSSGGARHSQWKEFRFEAPRSRRHRGVVGKWPCPLRRFFVFKVIDFGEI